MGVEIMLQEGLLSPFLKNCQSTARESQCNNDQHNQFYRELLIFTAGLHPLDVSPARGPLFLRGRVDIFFKEFWPLVELGREKRPNTGTDHDNGDGDTDDSPKAH